MKEFDVVEVCAKFSKNGMLDLKLFVVDESKKLEIKSFQTPIEKIIDVKEVLESEFKKGFESPCEIRYCCSAEEKLMRTNVTIGKIQESDGRSYEDINDAKKALEKERTVYCTEIIDVAEDNEISVNVDNPDELEIYEIEEIQDEMEERLDEEEDDEESEILEEAKEKVEEDKAEIERIDDELESMEELCGIAKALEEENLVIGKEDFSQDFIENELVIDSIMKNVPFGALVTFFTTYREIPEFHLYQHIFEPFMLPLEMTMAGYDGENFDMEKSGQCYQILKNSVYKLYKAIPGEETQD